MTAAAERAINVSLRGLTLGTRFFFIFFLAKYLDPASVGYYGIFTATVGYALYIVGLDFYTYASREIVKTPAERRGQLLKGQIALSGLIYFLLIPAIIFFLFQMNWPGYLAWWFLPILFLEHFNQELSRLLIAISEQLTASVILFIRQGSWAVAIIYLMAVNESARHLDIIMALWAAAGLMAALAGIWKLRQLETGGWRLPVDWAWIRKGVAISSAFLLATLALRGVQTFDRYWLEALAGIEMVGAYVLLFGVASTLIVFLDAALFSFTYPSLIRHSVSGEVIEIRRKVRILFVQTVVISGGFTIISYLLLPFLLDWINNPVYKQAAYWYQWILSAVIINALSLVPHYALYAQGQDKQIVYSHVVSLAVFGLAAWLLSGRFGADAIPISLNLAFLSILIWKALAYRSLLQNQFLTLKMQEISG